MIRYVKLRPLAGVPASRRPWRSTGAGVVYGADRKVICVLGNPDEGLLERDVRNGALILAAPTMLRALQQVGAIRPSNWDDGDDPEQETAWRLVDEAIAEAEARS